MGFEISDFNEKSLSELRDMFSTISRDQTEVEFIGCFAKKKPFESPLALGELSYPTKHVSAVKFSGKYVYSHNC